MQCEPVLSFLPANFSLRWFMGRLNEYIAYMANAEDKVKDRFWERRFKCQVLLDAIAVIACMVYVDLNPIRAGIATMLENSDFNNIQERILAWQKENMPMLASQSVPSSQSGNNAHSDSRLCPITSTPEHRGIMSCSEEQYLYLVDRSGNIVRAGKKSSINPDLEPILYWS
jgi:hypothetical protein